MVNIMELGVIKEYTADFYKITMSVLGVSLTQMLLFVTKQNALWTELK